MVAGAGVLQGSKCKDVAISRSQFSDFSHRQDKWHQQRTGWSYVPGDLPMDVANLEGTDKGSRQRHGAASGPRLPSLGRAENDGRFCRKEFCDVGKRAQGRTLDAAFQLTDIALGITKRVGQLLLAPALGQPQSRQLCAEGLR